jgi:hypothetical protein
MNYPGSEKKMSSLGQLCKHLVCEGLQNEVRTEFKRVSAFLVGVNRFRKPHVEWESSDPLLFIASKQTTAVCLERTHTFFAGLRSDP